MDELPKKGIEEKRRYSRIKGGAVEYRRIDTQDEYQSAFLVDLGVGGVCIFTLEDIQPGTKLSLRIYLDSNPGPLSVSGEVVWNKPFDSDNKKSKEHFYIGLQIPDLTPESKARIDSYINHFGPDGELPQKDDTLNL